MTRGLSRREKQGIPRGRTETVARLKRTCTLAQGFCMTLFIVCMLMAIAPVIRLVRVFVGPAGVDGWEGSTLFERMYLLGDGGRSYVDLMGLYGGTFGGQAYADRSWLGDPSLLITNDTAVLPQIVLDLAALLLIGAMLWVGMRFFGRIGSTGEPFRRERARDLTTVAWLLLAYAIVPGVLHAIALLVGTRLAPAASYEISYGLVSYFSLVAFCLVLGLGRIFAYGCILQEQDDGLV